MLRDRVILVNLTKKKKTTQKMKREYEKEIRRRAKSELRWCANNLMKRKIVHTQNGRGIRIGNEKKGIKCTKMVRIGEAKLE